MPEDSLESIFKAYDIRGKVSTQLKPGIVKDIARAYADWLPTGGIIAVGHDMRPDSKALSEAFMEGLTEQGREVWDIGQVTSDMIYFAVGNWDLAGGAVITASHNPGDDNGVKLYRDGVVPVGLDSGLSDIRDAFLNKSFVAAATEPGNRTGKQITEEWVSHCLKFIRELAPFNIAIDAGNGMAGAILPHILPKLPLNVAEMYFEPDGTFPNHEANPQNHDNLKDLIDKIKSNNLDFGIAFDGDGDRAAFVDDKGRPVLGSDLMAIVAKYYLKKYPGSNIIHEVRTSRATTELIREWGGKPVRTKAGRVNIGPKMRELNAPFGGETTGHLFFKENFDVDSGLIAALVAMQALTDSGKKLSELVDAYRRYSMAPEKSFAVKDSKKTLQGLSQVFKDGEQDWLDGLTVNYPGYWFNIRPSNTEPVIKLTAEASTQQQLDSLIDKISNIVS